MTIISLNDQGHRYSVGMGRASKSRAPSEYEYSNPELERVRASALILGPSLKRVRASFSSILPVVNANFSTDFTNKIDFCNYIFYSFLMLLS